MVNIDDMQFSGFVPGRGTTDAVSIFSQLQEKYFAANKPLYIAFVNLEKAFDRVPRKVIWWALRSVGVEEWAIKIIQGMYANARSGVRVNGQCSEEFGVGLGVHQGSVLSSLLFIPRHTLVSGYYVIPFGVCPSVRPSVRPCSPFPIDNLSIYSQNFFKFCIHIVIGDEWCGIVNGQNPSIFNGVTALFRIGKMVSGLLFLYCS